MNFDLIRKKLNDKIFFETENGILVNDNCINILPMIEDKSIDLILTDPPYGINGSSGTINKKRNCGGYINYEDTRENLMELVNFCFPHFVRISNRIVLTPGTKNYDLYPKADDIGVFFMPAGRGLSKWGRSDCDLIFYYGRDPRLGKTIDFKSKQIVNTKKDTDGHPCPKSIKAWEWLLNKSSLENEIVLDCFLGSGTTAIACEKFKRKWIGIEKEIKYCEIAKKRIEQELKQLKLF